MFDVLYIAGVLREKGWHEGVLCKLGWETKKTNGWERMVVDLDDIKSNERRLGLARK